MTTVTNSSGDGSFSGYSSPVLGYLEVMNLINRLEIADGLKQLLLSKGFALKSLLNTSASDLAEILGIDEYVAKIVSSAIKKVIATKDIAKEIHASAERIYEKKKHRKTRERRRSI